MAHGMRCASGGFLIRDGRVLLGQRAPDRELYPDVWDAIGGHVEQGETPADALVRELQEELGVWPSAFREVGVLQEPQAGLYGEADYHMFVVTSWRGGEPGMQGREHSAVRWCTFGELSHMRLAHPGYVQLLRGLLTNDAEMVP